MNAQNQIDMGMLPRKRVKHVRQSEATECGLASLAMIANWWGHDVNLGTLRREFGVSSRGIGLRQLMQTADALGFTTRPLKVVENSANVKDAYDGSGGKRIEGLAAKLGAIKLPAILHWDMNHFVVLEKVAAGRAYVVDPGVDGRWHDEASLSKHFTGVALEMTPSSSFTPRHERSRLTIRQLWSGASGFRRTAVQTIVLSLILQAHVLASPYLLQLAVDQALPSLDASLLAILAVGFGLFALINGVATLLRSFVLLSSGTALAFGISTNVARRLLRLPVQWFEKRTVGDVLSRFQSVLPVQKFLTESAAAAIIDGALAALTFALMLAYSPMLTIVPLASTLIYAAMRAVVFRPERAAEAERIAASGREQGAMIETLRGIVTLRLAGRETMRHAVWQNRLSESLGAKYAHERIRAWQVALGTLLGTLEIVAVVWLAVGQAIVGGFTVGMLLAFLAYRQQFTTTTRSLIDAGTDFRMLSLHLDRLSDIAMTEEDPGFKEPWGTDEFDGKIQIRNVSYRYGIHDPLVLKGVDLTIEPGEHVAITGTSGGGKATLAKILLGLIEPTHGEVLIDGLPMARFGRRAFREHVGAVLQDDVLFAGTIADNVAGFDAIDYGRMKDALRMASIEDDIAAMPMRHHTLVGDMGSTLSGGQRQRILLARALYRRPKVLVMDEGTAHLDAEHERAVNAAISEMGITRIVIAHRKETIEAADRVVVLNAGKICD